MSPKKPGPPKKLPPAQLAVGSVPAIPISRKGGDACARVDRVAEYLDGTLDPAAQDELLSHLADCEICQAALHGEVQIRDREDALRAQVAAASGSRTKAAASATAPAAPASAHSPTAPALLASSSSPAGVDSLDAARRKRAARWQLPAGIAAMAAVAATGLFVFKSLPDSSTGPAALPAPQLALAPKRSLEARLSWGPAAAHRPYDPMRSSTAALGEPISLEVRARLEKQKNCAGLAATYLLAGETTAAQRQYADPACSAPDTQADRAALAVTLGNFDEALELCDAVLADQPDHPVALWNRALALRGKNLGLAAAAAFDRVVASDSDPAWRAEAKERADAARAEHQRAQADWNEILQRGDAMIPDGEILPLELAKRVPGRARLRFHDAVRTATTRARLEALRPLARAIQEPGETSLEAAIDTAIKKLSPARAALVPHYVAIFRAQSVEGDAEWPAWQAKARAAGADDLLLGARYRALPDDAETARLATASKDPWFIGLSALDRFDFFTQEKSEHNVPGQAEQALRVLEAQCATSQINFLCLKAALSRAQLHLDRTQAPAAVAAGRQALELAQESGEVLLRASAVYHVAEGERLRSAYSVARASYDEYLEWMRLDNDCWQQQNTMAAMAAMAFDLHRFHEVGRLLRAVPTCDELPPRPLVDLQADVLTAELPLGVDVAAWRASVAKILGQPEVLESDQLFYGYLLERQALGIDPSSRTRLRQLAERAKNANEVTTASRVKAAAESSLAVDAGRRQQWAEVISIAAEAHDVASPQRCALAQAKDNFQLAFAVVSANGSVSGSFLPDIGAGYRWRLPASMIEELRSCDEISVLAFPPWPSGEPPLPAALPWHFVMKGSSSSSNKSASNSSLVIIAGSEPPAEQRLAQLAPIRDVPTGAILLSGSSATIENVASAAPTATLLEFHVHTSRTSTSDAPVLALSESGGSWALTAEEVSRWKLLQQPVVLLADCSSAVPAAYDHMPWGLPAAFLSAGARAVVAPLVDIPDGEGGAFFAQIREGLRTEPDVAKVVARLRAEKIEKDPASWVRNVVVFQ